MESRLPKPSGLKRPMTLTKNILPMDRIKPNTALLNRLNCNTSANHVPLSRDIVNLPSFVSRGRHLSPDLAKGGENRAKMRRSRSASDIRLIDIKSFKGFKPTGLFSVQSSTANALSRPPQTNGMFDASKQVDPLKQNIRGKLRRSRSACDLRINEVRATKRQELTLAPIPAKIARLQANNNVGKTFTAASKNKPSTSTSNTSTTSNLSNNSTLIKTKKGTSTNTSTTGAAKPINKRIPPYDFKARYNDLLEKHKALKAKYENLRENLSNLESLPEQYEESQSQLFGVRDELKNAQIEIECLQRQTNSQSMKIVSITKCLQTTKEEFENLKEAYEKLMTKHTVVDKEVVELRSQTSILTTHNAELLEELTACKEQLFKANMERKDLHNAVMDLRGNIRVFCRVRPPLEIEEDRAMCGWNYLDETSLEIHNLDPSIAAKNKNASHMFSFDHVFHPKSAQEDVFEMVSPLIQSALDGYNICIFAYGQTGSGKTYTMDGVQSSIGVIPRTVDLLFDSVKSYKHLGWEYEIKATFLEIYNDVLYDLLSNEQKDMEIRMVKNHKSDIYVTNITEETVKSANRLRQLMQIAKMNRATATTIGNDRSSRSHAVTKIELIGTHADKGEISVGTINLVDLAGSESPKTSIRMNETKNINRSLSELGNVISALLQKQDHVPYRNSKLTHLLMPSLGGNSKTLMFINVAPFQDCFVESVKSLRFAANVNSCKMAKAKKTKYLNTSASLL